MASPATPVPPVDLEEGVGLPEAAGAHCVHQHGKVVAVVDDPPALSSNPAGLPSKLADLSSNPPPAATSALSTRFDEAARRDLLDDLPGSLAARLGAIGQRHPPQEVQGLVVELCGLRAWRTDELSLVLRRNPEVVRQSYLRPLMREGRLTMTRPEEPNDPQQAYRTVGAPLSPPTHGK